MSYILRLFVVLLLLPGGIAPWCLADQMTSHPSLSQYERVDRIWISTLSGMVTVDPVIDLEALIPGKVRWFVENGEIVTKGKDLFVMNAEALDLSERDLQLRRSKLSHEKQEARWSVEAEKQTSRKQVLEMENRILELDLSPTEIGLLGSDAVKEIREEERELRKLIEEKKAKLEGDHFEEYLENQIAALQLDFDLAEFKYEESKKEATISAVERGKVTINSRESNVRDSQIVGTLERSGIAECTVELIDSRSRSIPKEELVITVQGSDGNLYDGVFKRVEKTVLGQSNSVTLTFELSGSVQKPTRETLEGMRIVRLFRKFDKPVIKIPKEPFLLRHTKEVRDSGWRGLVEKLWGDVEVIYVGPKEIAVREKNED